MSKIGGDALDDGINGIDMPVGGLDGIAGKKVKNQQTVLLIVISAFRQSFVAHGKPRRNVVRADEAVV